MPRANFSSDAPPRPRLFRPLLLGVTAIGVFFGGFGAWAALTPLSSAASAPGQVRVQSYRKTVQHLEGGIIQELLVKEGEVVKEGQVLVRLDDIQASASLELLNGQIRALRAQEARLLAERDGLAEVFYPEELLALRSEPQVEIILSGQNAIFDSRRVSLAGQVDLLEQRVSQLGSEIEAYQAQVHAAEIQIGLVEEEAATVRDLTERGYEKRPRLLALERELAKLNGDRGEQLGMIARAEQAIGEARLKIADLRNAQSKEVTAELRDVQIRLNELEDRLRVANDVQARTEILAPQAGRVVQLRHVTPGGIIRPGDAILDLVPINDEYVIEARISPLDIDTVHPGLDAEVRLTGLSQRRLPILLGKVVTVSADALTDERTGATYYLTEISLPLEQLPLSEDVQLHPGMPCDVLVVTGNRTPFEYFIDPIRDSFRKAFREE